MRKTLICLCLLVPALGIGLVSCSSSTDPDRPSNYPPNTPVIDTLAGAPPDRAVDWSITPLLQWIASDPDGDLLTYDLYFGTDENPPMLIDSLIYNSYMPDDTLAHETTYFWRVVARDEHGALTSSPFWRFTTGAFTDPLPPTAVLTAPMHGAVVSGNVDITVDAVDNIGVVSVVFYIDSAMAYADYLLPWKYTWNTATYPGGSSHTIFARAYDAAGNFGTTETVTVTIAQGTR